MSKYVENNLAKGEEDVLYAKINWLKLVPQILWLIVCVVAAIAVNVALSGQEVAPGNESMGMYILLILLVAGILPLIVAIIRLACTSLAITNRRVLGKTGVIKRDALDLHIDKVDTIKVKSTFWGSILKYSTITVLGGGNDKGLNFEAISNANEFRNKVNDAVEQHAAEARKAQAEEIARAMSMGRQG